MHLTNSKTQYGSITILIHWLMAMLIIGLLALGLYMVRLPLSMEKLKLFGWHKEYGFLAFFLVIFRIAWRATNVTPALPPYLPDWQKITARAVHYVFYLFMFFIPLTGWLLTSSAGFPVSFFGLFVMPDLISANESYRVWFTQIHLWLSYALIAFILLHSAAALQHHFINKDDVLRRMLP